MTALNPNYLQTIQTLIEQLPECPTDHLYQLKIAIEKEITHPDRLAKLKHSFRIGEMISIYDPDTDQIIKALACKKNPKYVVVQMPDTKKYWDIPYHFICTSSITANRQQTKKSGQRIDRNTVKIGDHVSFEHDGIEHLAIIERLNQKTAGVKTTQGKRWRVSYEMLYYINIVDQKASVDISHADYTVLPYDNSST